jgi:hypothetical protein
MGDRLQSFGSPCLHAPHCSCLKHAESTANQRMRQRNPFSLQALPATSSANNAPKENGHLSLSSPRSLGGQKGCVIGREARFGSMFFVEATGRLCAGTGRARTTCETT